jgi:hypothetical protein
LVFVLCRPAILNEKIGGLFRTPMELQKTTPVDVAHLMPVLDDKLIELLNSLSEAEWNTQTIAKRRTVKDVAAQLLDTNIRLLSVLRDGYFGEEYTGTSHAELVEFLNRLNADWVRSMKRVSPQMMIMLHELTGKPLCDFMLALDPFETSMLTGRRESLNWMEIAREYTEKWLHQQQIRDALSRPGLLTRELFQPFINVFMTGLPHAYREVIAEEGTVIQITVTSEIGGSWWLRRRIGRWALVAACNDVPAAQLEIDPDSAWKLFSKSLRPDEIMDKVTITGRRELADPALSVAWPCG